MDPNDYARKEIKKMMPQFAVAPSVCPEPQGTYTVFSWGASKGDGMEYGHYTWKALPEGTEFYGIDPCRYWSSIFCRCQESQKHL